MAKWCIRGTMSRSQAAHAACARVEQLGLGELATGHEQDVDVVLRNDPLEVGQRADVRTEGRGVAVPTVVEEAGDGEPVARVTPEDPDDVGSECAAAHHERAMGDHPPLTRREDEAAGDEPAEQTRPSPGSMISRNVSTPAPSWRRANTEATSAAATRSRPTNMGSSSSTERCRRAR